MQFLLDANMPRSAADTIRAHGHSCVHVRDIGMGGAADSLIADHARSRGLALVTRDGDFADIRNYPPGQYHGLVVLELPDHATASMVATTIAAFLADGQVLALLPGRLAIVQPGRIRPRPA